MLRCKTGIFYFNTVKEKVLVIQSNLSSTYEEADSKMMFQIVQNISESSKFVIRTIDATF